MMGSHLADILPMCLLAKIPLLQNQQASSFYYTVHTFG